MLSRSLDLKRAVIMKSHNTQRESNRAALCVLYASTQQSLSGCQEESKFKQHSSQNKFPKKTFSIFFEKKVFSRTKRKSKIKHSCFYNKKSFFLQKIKKVKEKSKKLIECW